jgi:hypothetical protein
MSFSPTKTEIAVKLLMMKKSTGMKEIFSMQLLHLLILFMLQMVNGKTKTR